MKNKNLISKIFNIPKETKHKPTRNISVSNSNDVFAEAIGNHDKMCTRVKSTALCVLQPKNDIFMF